MQRYQTYIGQINYLCFLLLMAGLPYSQVFLRYVSVAWIISWALEGRWLKKENIRPMRLMAPFFLFGGWFLWKVVSGLWVTDMDVYLWYLERYMAFGLMIPIGIWGVNAHYNWKHSFMILSLSTVSAAVAYPAIMYWVHNHSFVEGGHGERTQMTLYYFEENISYIKHRMFLCCAEITGVIATIYVRKDIVKKIGKLYGWLYIVTVILMNSALIICTGSRASIVAAILLIGAAILIHAKPDRKLWAAVILLCLTVVSIFGFVKFHPRMQDFRIDQLSIKEIQPNRESRLNIWAAALQHTEDYSLKGLGAGETNAYLMKKYEANGLTYFMAKDFHTHNQYLMEWIEIGIPGMTFFVLCWLALPICILGKGRELAIYLTILGMTNMFTDCLFGKYDGIIIFYMILMTAMLQSTQEIPQNPEEQLPSKNFHH